MTDGQKIQQMRNAFARLAVEQPAHNIVKTWALEANDLPVVAMAQLYDILLPAPKPTMTLEDFASTARIVLEADEERIEYLEGACNIALVVRGPEYGAGIFCLTIANESEQGFDLRALEAKLYDWAASEGHFEKKEG